jgi:microcystin-dependent protein
MKYYLVLLVLLFSSFSNAAFVASRGFPGTIFMWGGSSCPSHSVAADGASLLRAGAYANLFSAISTANGTADGTHFNVPDLRGKFVRGVDGSASNDPDHSTRTACATGGATGNNIGSCEADDYLAHAHTVTQWWQQVAGSGHFTSFAGTGGGGLDSNTAISTSTMPASGGSETRPKNVYVLYCVWY